MKWSYLYYYKMINFSFRIAILPFLLIIFLVFLQYYQSTALLPLCWLVLDCFCAQLQLWFQLWLGKDLSVITSFQTYRWLLFFNWFIPSFYLFFLYVTILLTRYQPFIHLFSNALKHLLHINIALWRSLKKLSVYGGC